MTDHRPDIPDLPRGFFWFEDRLPSVWNKRGVPAMTVRKRTIFRSKLIARQDMTMLDYTSDPHDRTLIRENAQRALGKVMGL